MGMSAEALQGQQGSPAGTEQGQGQPVVGTQQQDEYSLAGEFLGGIPDNVRPLIEPYVKQWDAQVTRKFQELHSQYQPYKELGDPETIQQAMAIAQALDENPQVIYDLLREELEGAGAQGAGALPGSPTAAPPTAPVGGLPPEVIERLDRTENILAQMGQLILQDRQAREQSQEDAEFEEYLGQLKQKFGDFDEDWVTLQISRGMDGEQAAQAWLQKTQEIVNAAGGGQQTPPVLGGGSVVPQDQLNVKDVSRNDLKSLVAGMLNQANQGG